MLGACTPDRCQAAAWPQHKTVCVTLEQHTVEFVALVCQVEAEYLAGNTQAAVVLGQRAEKQYTVLLARAGSEVKARVYEDVCALHSSLGSALCACGLEKKAVVVYSDFALHCGAAGDFRMKCGLQLLVADLLVEDDTERAYMLQMLESVHDTSVRFVGCNDLQSKSTCAISYLLQRNAAEMLSAWRSFEQEALVYTLLAIQSQLHGTTAALKQHDARAEGDNAKADACKMLRTTMATNQSNSCAGANTANADVVAFQEKYYSACAQALQFARESVDSAQKMTAAEASVHTAGRLDEANALVCLIGVSVVKSHTFDESLLDQLAVLCPGLRGQPDSLHEMHLHTFRTVRYRATGEYTRAADECHETWQLALQMDGACFESIRTIATKALVVMHEMWQAQLIEVDAAEQTRLWFTYMQR